MASQYYSINDVVYATLFNDPKGQLSNADPALLREYVAYNRLIKKNTVKEQSGLEYRWRVNVQGTSTATTFGPYHRPTRGVSSHLQRAQMELGRIRNDFSCDELEEEMNSGAAEVVDVVKNRDQNCLIDAAATVESKFWSYADTTDVDSPQGILYWLPRGTTQGFYGTTSGSHTTVAGLNPSTYTGWKSYTDQYVAVTEDDLIARVTLAMDKTMFKAPLQTMLIPEFSSSFQYGLYMQLAVAREIEKKARDQNDNLGMDVDATFDRTMIRGLPLTKVHALDTNTYNPVIGINWAQIQNRVKWWARRVMVPRDASQPLTMSVDYYWVYQTIMHNRRTGGFNISL